MKNAPLALQMIRRPAGLQSSLPSSQELLDAAYMLADAVRRQESALANALIGARALAASEGMTDQEVERAVRSWFS